MVWALGIRSSATGSRLAGYQRKVQQRYDETLEDVVFDMEEIMDDAATEMRTYISTRGVDKTVPNFDGRGSGRMENAVNSRVRRYGDVVKGFFGWLPGEVDSEQLRIYGWQESGTLDQGQPEGDPDPRPQGERTNRGIRPMMAMYDASRHAEEELARRFRGRRFNG